MKSFISMILLTLTTISINAQSQTQHVLFVGNSYTYYNNMPQIVANIALSLGDELIYDSSTPGGHTLEQHSKLMQPPLGKIETRRLGLCGSAGTKSASFFSYGAGRSNKMLAVCCTAQ
jgi:hypothetical protein